jgi:hypothetical protein
MFNAITPLKGKDRKLMAPDWLINTYSIMRSTGTEIEPEGGLFRLLASQEAITAYFECEMDIVQAPQTCDIVFRPASAARETAFRHQLYVKYLGLVTDLKTAIIGAMDHDDILAVTGNKTTDAFPVSAYLRHIETSLCKNDIARKQAVRAQNRPINEHETIQAYISFFKKMFQDIALTQEGVEVNEFDKFMMLVNGIAKHTQLACAYDRYLQSLGDTPESFADLATFLEAQWNTFHLTAKAAGYAASAAEATPSDRIAKIEEMLVALTTATALAAGGVAPPPQKDRDNCYRFAETNNCKLGKSCRFLHTPGPIVAYCWVCGAFGAGASGSHTTVQCKHAAAKALSADKKASLTRLLPTHKDGDACGRTKFTSK